MSVLNRACSFCSRGARVFRGSFQRGCVTCTEVNQIDDRIYLTLPAINFRPVFSKNFPYFFFFSLFFPIPFSSAFASSLVLFARNIGDVLLFPGLGSWSPESL